MPIEMGEMNGKRVLVTAAGAGLGRTIAERFLESGAAVHICDADPRALDGAARALRRLTGSVADVGDATQVDRLFEEALSELGGLDVLVNNAGIAGEVGPIESLSTEGWQRTLAVNLSGAFYCCRRAVPALRESGGGSIVNVGSTAGLLGFPNRTPYSASKWGLVGLTRALATELGEHAIRVNAVCPGSVEGGRIESVIRAEAEAQAVSVDAVRERYLRQGSITGFATADQVAAMVLFLCSASGAHVSGQAIAIDGNTQSVI